MFGLGTIVNTVAIIIGGLIGLVAGGLLKERFQKILTVAMGLSVTAMSLSGIVSKMLIIEGEKISTHGTYMIIFSLVLGAIVGEMIDIDRRLEQFGIYLKRKTGNAKDAAFVDGFVTSSLTVCIGAMAVMGSIMDAIYGDHSILFTKALMDLIIIMVMTASMGKGCIFSAIPVFIFQGSITVLATFIAPLLSDKGMDNLSLTGSILILCIGINILADGKYKIKVANMLPAIIFAVVASYIPFFD